MTTPLASIFGSGFLVIVSVLGESVGPYSVFAMAGVCALAFSVGMVVRYNIRHAEPVLQQENPPRLITIFSTVAQAALIAAYVISVALYVRILASYALGFFNVKSNFDERLLTTAVIGLVLLMALTKGLTALEAGKKWALGTTVLIIIVLICAFGVYDIHALTSGHLVLPAFPQKGGYWHMITVLAGTLIVVQGFETTRYLGDQFDAQARVRAARDAQIVSSLVYLLLVGLATPLMQFLPKQAQADALMHLAGIVAFWLTYPLVLTAVLSQFSAAIADAISGSGSLIEVTRRKISARLTYILICLAA
ncbi:MAG TPA: hypothetical protein PLY97_11880, partial [Acidocella sp.]|nr:hypothetical protein [Acidocella sp.]